MAKKTTIPFFEDCELEDLTRLGKKLETAGKRLFIKKRNWKNQFPYQPLTAVSLAYSPQALYLHVVVREMTLRTLAEKDGCYVHEDSCVEFFMQPFEGTDYINFEFNAAGICYAAHHMNDTASVKFTPEEFAQIKRYTKLAGQKIEEQEGPVFWELSVSIPWQTMGYPEGMTPRRLRANFYKCADGTEYPHYLSWSPVDLPEPNFHCPKFFGSLKLKKRKGKSN